MTYPRVVTCGITGIKAIVDSPEEEDDFHGCILKPLAALIAVLVGLVVFMLAYLLT